MTQRSLRLSRRHRAQQGTEHQAIGKSNGRWTTKILTLTDAPGNLVRFVLLPGTGDDTTAGAPLIRGLSFDALLADKTFDANWINDEMTKRGAVICILQRPQRKEPL